MSTARATKRPNGKAAPEKARPARPSSARAAPEKNNKVLRNAGEKPARIKPSNAGKGRVKGVPNVVTRTVREVVTALVEDNAPRAQELMDRVARKNPAKWLVIWTKLAEFVLPRLQRTEFTGELNHHGLRARKPWPYPDGLGNDPIEMWSMRYKMMISGEYELPSEDMQKMAAEATYRKMKGEDAEDIKVRLLSQPQPAPLPAAPPPRPRVEVLRPAGLPVDELPSRITKRDVEEAELVPVGPSPEDIAADEALRHQRPWVIT